MSLAGQSISFSYGRTPVLDDVSLELRTRTVTALFGPNGTGKSTLFRCLLGHLAHSGEVFVDGESATGWSARRMARQVGFVPQDHRAVFPHIVRDMVTMGAAASGSPLTGPTRESLRTALERLDQLGLLHLAERSFPSLSGGQRQLVLIARALAQDTPYLLLDEPTASLDFGNQNLIWSTVRDLAHAEGKGILVCSHDPNHVLWFCDEAITLRRDGSRGPSGSAAEVITQHNLEALYPGSPVVAAVGGSPVVLPGRRA